MSVLKIGKVRPTYKGDWNAEVAYEPLDWVLYRGVAYQALGEVPVNREPDVNPDYWVQTGMKGDKGDKGEPGERGPAGVDGRDGAEGAQGAMGPMPGHQWDGGKLAFQNPDGSFAPSVDLQGPQGVQGPEGPVGPQGIPGPAGAQGPAGPQGVKGDTGATPALNNTVTSTSTTQAATANAVKTAYDKAVEAFNNTVAVAERVTTLEEGGSVPRGQIAPFYRVTLGGSDGRRPIFWGQTVPDEGWVLCDGGSDGDGGTVPDLRGRMIMGASNAHPEGSAGGAATHTHTVTGSVGATTLSTAQMPSHTHATWAGQGTLYGAGVPAGNGSMFNTANGLGYTGGSQAHTHSLSSATAAAADTLPPYHALVYLARIGR